MHYGFSFLPLEVQTSLKEMIAFGVPESAVDLLTDRIFKGLEAKTISLQKDVERIELAVNNRVDAIGDRLDDRQRIQNGETNQMLVDVRSSMQNQEAAFNAMRATFHDDMQTLGERVSDNTLRIEGLESWRGEVDAALQSFRASRDQSIEERRQHTEDLTQSKADRKSMRDTISAELPAIREVIASQDKRHEETERQLGTIATRLAAIEALLEPTGEHEAGD